MALPPAVTAQVHVMEESARSRGFTNDPIEHQLLVRAADQDPSSVSTYVQIVINLFNGGHIDPRSLGPFLALLADLGRHELIASLIGGSIDREAVHFHVGASQTREAATSLLTTIEGPQPETSAAASDAPLSESSRVISATGQSTIELASIDHVERIAQQIADGADDAADQAIARAVIAGLDVLRLWVSGDTDADRGQAAMLWLETVARRILTIRGLAQLGADVLDLLGIAP